MTQMRNHLSLSFILLSLALLVLITPLSGLAEAPAVAGHVIIAKGTVNARSAEGEARPLRRRSPFYAGEVLVTGQGSMAQVRFEDGALLSLKPETEFRVDRYRFEAEGGEGDESISTLLKGGFRTITGAIGKQDPDSYKVTTPVATIGVRGTHYEVALTDQLVVAVWEGGVEVRNDQGKIDLGVGGNYNFAAIKSANQPPRGLLKPPPGLEGGVDAEPAPAAQAEDDGSGESDSEASEASSGTSDTDADAADDQDGAGVDTSETDDTTAETAATDQDATATDTQTTTTEDTATVSDSGTTSTDESSLDGAALDSTLADDSTVTLDSSTTTSTATTDATVDTTFTATEPVNTLGDISSGDARLTDTEWKSVTTGGYVGMAITAGPGSKGIRGGRSTSPSLGPVITDVGDVTNVFANPETTPIVEVWRQGTAPNGPTINPANPYGVQWGVWNGNATDPVVVQLDPNDPAKKMLIDKPVFWATAIPALETDIATRAGMVRYDNLLAITGGGSGGMVTAGNVLEQHMDIDFSSGAITGILDLSFQIGASQYQTWIVDYDGQLRGNFVDIKLNGADVSDLDPSLIGTVPETDYSMYTTYWHNVDGSIGGVLVGPKGKGYAGGFDLESQQNPNIHTEGLILMDCANDPNC